jgi:hypothetical protein
VITSSRSSLSVYSDVRTLAEITEALGIEPTSSRSESLRLRWSFDPGALPVDPDDATGFGSLRVLIDSFRDRAGALRADC